jgi:WD40 repeat protein
MLNLSRLLLAIGLLIALGPPALAQEPKGWLGADTQDVSKAEADRLGWDNPRGAKLGVVAPGSPADKAGLKTGDIIVAVERTMIDTASDIDAAMADKRPGTEMRLQVLSGGRERRVTLVLGERPAARVVAADAKPYLMLDTGGHMTKIQSLTFTPDGKYVVSGSDDKTVRVWDWAAGKTVRTIRGQVGPGDEGKVYAAALSPDGKVLVTGGYLGTYFGNKPREDEEAHKIRIYDFATGELKALLRGHINVVNSLAFSPDGKLLISGGADYTAIIWDVQQRKLLQRLKGHKEQIYGVAFMPDGARAVTGSDDTTLRMWRVNDGGLIAELKGHKEDVSRALAIRTSDSMIASGDGTGEIRLWDGKTGQFLKSLQSPSKGVGALAFSPDGQKLLATSGRVSGRDIGTVWDVATGKDLVQYAKHDNIIIAAAISPDGRLAITGGGSDKSVHVWDMQTGETRQVLAGTGVPGWAAGFSPDGQRIGWGSTWKNAPGQSSHTSEASSPIEFQLQLPSLNQRLGRPERVDETTGKSFLRAHLSSGPNSLSHRKAGIYGHDAILELKSNGQVKATIERGSSDGYQHRAYAFSPDGQMFVSGGANGILTAYDSSGKQLGFYVGHEGDIWAVTPSPDGRLLISGSGDQTVRLWNLKSRELLATLFRGRDEEWVMWTPQGYYTGSPGADKLVGWQINKGVDRSADHVGAEQLRHHLNRPDIVEKAIILASAEQAVREAPGTTFQLADLLRRPVPRFKVVSTTAGTDDRSGRAIVRINVDASPDPVKAIRVQVNGRQVEEQTPDIGTGGFNSGEHVLSVPLAKGRNDIRITLSNAIGDKAESLTVNRTVEGDLDRRGTLYILAIGVDKYPALGKTCGANSDESCDLSFSSSDARALVAAVEKRLRPSHNDVIKRVLVNGADEKNLPTASNILDAMDLLKQSQENDTVLLFIAGHGFNDGPNYRFLATNAERLGEAFRSNTVVPWQILQEAIETAKGRRILFIDTCHSGNAYNQRLGNAAYHANIIAYTAARYDQEAIEDAKLGHGLFTYAVVEGLEGGGGLDTRRQISTRELADYVVKRVGALAKAAQGEQEPQYYKGRDAEDYVLARW